LRGKQRKEAKSMTTPKTPGDAAATKGKPNEFTAIAPEFSGKVSNRPTPSGADVTEFDRAVEAERQEDA
jgi:hypothetical protein